MHLHILDVDFVVDFSLMDIPIIIIMIMGFMEDPHTDPHLGNMDIIECHVEVLVLVLMVVDLVSGFNLIEVVEVEAGVIDTTGIAEIDINKDKGVIIKSYV